MRKKLEDIIPKEKLDYILRTYQKIKDIEKSCLKDYELLIKQLVEVEEALQKIVDTGWLSEWFKQEMYKIINNAALYHNKKGLNADLHLFMKSELETTISKINFKTGQLTVSRKTKGQPKQYAKSFLIGTLSAEVKACTGKANYKLLVEFLKPYYAIDANRLAIEIKRIRESYDLIHLVNIIR